MKPLPPLIDRIRAYTDADPDQAMQRTLAEIRALPETRDKPPPT